MTKAFANVFPWTHGFQLTRSRGAWLIDKVGRIIFVDNFNSHAHVERDINHLFPFHNHQISTHTLTWSVTFPFNANIKIYIHFNSHAHVERDFIVEFSITSLSNFNSHAHVERDFPVWPMLSEYSISTHTLTWSVTMQHAIATPPNIFQLTRSRGAWPVTPAWCVTQIQISTHTLTWSVTILQILTLRTLRFQLTRSRGAWHW